MGDARIDVGPGACAALPRGILRVQLAALERAEHRLAAGTYGLSIDSGKQIPDERLEVLPTAELTAKEERARAGRHER